jgi:hypothetical protein
VAARSTDRAGVLEPLNDFFEHLDRRAVAGDGDGVRDPDTSVAQRNRPHRRASPHAVASI